MSIQKLLSFQDMIVDSVTYQIELFVITYYEFNLDSDID